MTITIDDFMSEPIKISVEPYGTMEFTEFLFRDLNWLHERQTMLLPVREFLVQLLHANLLAPLLEIQEMRNWTDATLLFVAIHWVTPQLKEHILPENTSFEDVKQAIYGLYTALTSDGLLGTGLQEYFQSQQALVQAVTGITRITSSLHTVGTSISSLSSNIFGMSQIINSIAVPPPLMTPALNEITRIQSLAQPFLAFGSLFQQIASSTQYITGVLSGLTNSLPDWSLTSSILQANQVFAALPNLADLNKLLDEAHADNETYGKAGYAFTSDYVSISTVRRFATINPRVRNAVITNHWMREVRSSTFEQQLQTLFQQSSVLRRRWPIVRHTIAAHRRREYTLAVPALLAQIEGVIGDMLIMKGLVAAKGYKLYEKGRDGRLRRDKKQKFIEARGLGTLVERSNWQHNPALQAAADLITTRLAGERNSILHGRRTNYATPKLANQGLLLLLVLAAEVTEFEAGRVQTDEIAA